MGGYPLLPVHGYPETKRIWWRNIRPLAEAGYEVAVPDLRGYGDSDLSAADFTWPWCAVTPSHGRPQRRCGPEKGTAQVGRGSPGRERSPSGRSCDRSGRRVAVAMRCLMKRM
ncbi:alpha/beta fold hydrolase [Uniformispora flossi]|uniref:alpha/beta fold hydrolase n=1 Tax=Uniformispora flossi TaxID=3390723 RepID=UPI003CFF0B89